MTARTSQYMPMEEVPEKSWAYRLAKRFFFNDFGAYEGAVSPLGEKTAAG